MALALITTACGSDAGGPVASVGDRSLSESDFRALLEAKGGGDEPVISAALAAEIISEWITWESWIAEMAARDTPLGERQLALARADLEAQGGEGSGLPAPDDDAFPIFERYFAVPHLVADHMIEVEDVRVLCSSHILVETEGEALAAIERLEAGEDFAALAVELSTGPSGPTGGDLGCVDPRGFVAEFVEGAAQVDPPGISAPTESQFGWHVISVRSFGSPDRDSHPELSSGEITNFVLGGYDPEIREIVEVVTDREIEVAGRYGVWDPATRQVLPPGSAN